MPERPPTSHEQRAGASWDASYTGGPAPWDIDRPQPAFARLAAARGLDVDFQVGDALHLSGAFDTVLDCGLFHTFDADERRTYVASPAAVTRGRLCLLCFGAVDVPHPVTGAELRAAFADGWQIASLVPDVIETRFAPDGVPAWLATIERLART